MTFVDWVRGWRLVSVVAVVAIAGFAIYRLTDDTTPTADIESGVRSQIAEQVGEEITIVSVDCPETVEWDPGEEFHCFANAADGTTARITVHMESGDGEYTWAVE